MKKLYSLFLFGTMAAVSASAAEPLTLTVSSSEGLVEKTMSPISERIVLNAEGAIEVTPEMRAFLDKQASSGMKRGPEGTWNDLGECTVNDGVLASLLVDSEGNNPFATSWPANAQQHATEKGWYRINDAWANNELIPGNITLMGSVNWDINCTDPNKVEAELTHTALNVISPEVGEVQVFPIVAYYKAANETDKITDAMYAKYSNGIINFPVGSLYYYCPQYNPNTLYQAKEMSIELPGSIRPEVKMTMPYCAADNKLIVSVTTNDAVALTKLFVAKGAFEASEENIKAAAANSALQTDRHSFQLNFSPVAEAHYQMYTLFAIGLDAAGNIVTSAVEYGYATPTDNNNWRRLEGKARMTEGLVAGYFKNYEPETYDVDIEENVNTPGYYRLVNPYHSAWSHYEESVHEEDHVHYLYIDASDPDKVILEEAPIGIDFGSGCIRVSSPAYSQIAAGRVPDASICGKLANRRITFPSRSIAISERYFNNNTWYTANAAGKFSVSIPEQNGVDNIVTDSEATPEYFNLQGVRVDRPTPGTIVIVRRGTNVTKEAVR